MKFTQLLLIHIEAMRVVLQRVLHWPREDAKLHVGWQVIAVGTEDYVGDRLLWSDRGKIAHRLGAVCRRKLFGAITSPRVRSNTRRSGHCPRVVDTECFPSNRRGVGSFVKTMTLRSSAVHGLVVQ